MEVQVNTVASTVQTTQTVVKTVAQDLTAAQTEDLANIVALTALTTQTVVITEVEDLTVVRMVQTILAANFQQVR